MEPRDEAELARIEGLLERILPEDGCAPGLSAAAVDDLVTRIYGEVHTGLTEAADLFSSNRDQFGDLVARAEAELGDLRGPVTGFEVVGPVGDRLVRCPEGVEVRLPPDVPVPVVRDVTTLVLPCLAAPLGARWLHWRRADGVPVAPHDGRIYLNALPEYALDLWFDVVRALAASPVATKVGGSASMLARRDCVVVYCPRDALPGVLDRLTGLALEDRLEATVPGFSAEVAPGIGVALDDGPAATPGLAASIGYTWSQRVVDAWTARGRAGVSGVRRELGVAWQLGRASCGRPVPEAVTR